MRGHGTARERMSAAFIQGEVAHGSFPIRSAQAFVLLKKDQDRGQAVSAQGFSGALSMVGCCLTILVMRAVFCEIQAGASLSSRSFIRGVRVVKNVVSCLRGLLERAAGSCQGRSPAHLCSGAMCQEPPTVGGCGAQS